MDLLPWALRAIAQGFHIFPCEAGDKRGALVRPDRDWRIKWSNVATRDARAVAAWWRRNPAYNIGIACKPSGLLVVDCDIPQEPDRLKGTPYEHLHHAQGPFVDGVEVLKAMCARFSRSFDELMDTYQVCTTKGGLHLYYHWPVGVRASQASPAPGVLDVRGNGGSFGGYVLGAGSVTAKGPYTIERQAPIADCPPWLVELLRDKPPPIPVRPPRYTHPWFTQPGRIGSGNYSGLADTVRFAGVGNRANALFWAARAMCSDGADIEQAEDVLVPAYLEADGDGGERQARASIRSAYRNQQAKEG